MGFSVVFRLAHSEETIFPNRTNTIIYFICGIQWILSICGGYLLSPAPLPKSKTNLWMHWTYPPPCTISTLTVKFFYIRKVCKFLLRHTALAGVLYYANHHIDDVLLLFLAVTIRQRGQLSLILKLDLYFTIIFSEKQHMQKKVQNSK